MTESESASPIDLDETDTPTHTDDGAGSAIPDAPPFCSAYQPAHDFIYFRPVKQEQVTAAGIVLSAATHNMQVIRVCGVGPGRVMGGGGLRIPQCKVGDYLQLNCVIDHHPQSGAPIARPPPITEFTDDDGETTHIVGYDFVTGSRPDKPPAVVGKQKPLLARPDDEEVLAVTRDKGGNGLVKLQ